jgi:hypothetical protein
LAAALKEILGCCNGPIAKLRRLQNNLWRAVVTCFVDTVTRFGAAVVQCSLTRTCAAARYRDDPIPDSRKNARTRRTREPLVAARDKHPRPSRHGGIDSPNRVTGGR